MPRTDDSAIVRDLEARLAEALEHQAATCEILRAIGGSPTDMQTGVRRDCSGRDATVPRRLVSRVRFRRRTNSFGIFWPT